MNLPPDHSPEVCEETVLIPAAGDWVLTGTLFSNEAAGSSAPIVLMSSAAGVPRGIYAHFARHLVEQGAAAVLTYDYRGIADSSGDRKKWPQLRMFDWAINDFPACVDWLQEKYPGHPLVGMGHSYGGQALGLSGTSDRFERFATVATMNGYWKDLDTPWSVWFSTQILGRPTAKLLGYVPKRFSPGEAFPGTIMLDWCKWIRSKDYWFDDPSVPGKDNFKKVTLPYLSIGITDDPWGNEKAISTFMRHYTNADLKQVWVEPGKSGTIGHLGYFRRQHKDHWPVAVEFLLGKEKAD